MNNMDNVVRLKHFHFWCQKVLPLVYDDSLSYYEVLCKINEILNTVISNEDILISVVEGQEEDIETLKQMYEEIKDELESIRNGEGIDFYITALATWINNNLQTLVAKIAKQVVFGLTTNGYFAAWIPDSWDFLSFDTIVDPTSKLYGHLVMRY